VPGDVEVIGHLDLLLDEGRRPRRTRWRECARASLSAGSGCGSRKSTNDRVVDGPGFEAARCVLLRANHRCAASPSGAGEAREGVGRRYRGYRVRLRLSFDMAPETVLHW
jgi:hypothetical protein